MSEQEIRCFDNPCEGCPIAEYRKSGKGEWQIPAEDLIPMQAIIRSARAKIHEKGVKPADEMGWWFSHSGLGDMAVVASVRAAEKLGPMPKK